MAADLPNESGRGLERLCKERVRTGTIRGAGSAGGIERFEARFHGRAYAPHRHDTYALGVTIGGVQAFRYRGVERLSTPGHVIILHPDELHDGAAGTNAELRYRMLYLSPALIQQASGDEHAALPFVREPVVDDPTLRAVLADALRDFDGGLEALARDDLVVRLAARLDGLAGKPQRPVRPRAWQAVERARDFLQENVRRPVRSEELEAVSGLDRFACARHFRACFGTSPHRFHMMRRLERSRAMIAAGEALAEIAVATGFADQAHFTRAFKRCYGVAPGRWADLVGASS